MDLIITLVIWAVNLATAYWAVVLIRRSGDVVAVVTGIIMLVAVALQLFFFGF